MMIVTLAFIFAIGVYNAAIQREQARIQSLRDSYAEARWMLARHQAVLNNRGNFLSALTVQHLQVFWRDYDFSETSLARAQISPPPRYDLEGLLLEYDLESSFNEVAGPYATPLTPVLIGACRTFGQNAARAFDRPSLEEKRATLIHEAARSTVHPGVRHIILDKVPYGYFDGYLNLAPGTIARWVVTGRIGKTCCGPDERFASYVETRPERTVFRRDTSEEQHLLDALNGVPIEQYGPAIHREIERRFAALMNYSPGASQIGVPSLGVTITLQQALMIAAPSLLFLFVLFAASRALETGSDGRMLSPAFPQFRSPADPLHLPLPATLAEVLERIVWMLVLVAPLLIPMVGVLARYDLQGLEESQRTFDRGRMPYIDHSWSALLLRRRSSDGTSRIVDLVTLVCLCLQMLLAVDVTGTPSGKKRFGPWAGVLAAATSVALVWYVFRARDNVILASSVAGGLVLIAAIWRRSVLMSVVCALYAVGTIALMIIPVLW